MELYRNEQKRLWVLKLVGKNYAYSVIGIIGFLLLVPLGAFSMHPPMEVAHAQAVDPIISWETISGQVAHAQTVDPIITVEERYTTTQLSETEFVYTSHEPYILDTITDVYTPYIIKQDSDFVQVELNGGKISIDKTECAATYFKDSEGIIIKSETYNVRTAEIDTDVWNHLDVNDVACSTTVLEQDEGVIVTLSKVNSEGLFELEYDIKLGKVKTTAYFTNQSYQNNKFAFTQSVQLLDPLVKLNGQEYDLTELRGENFDRETLEQNMDLALEAKELYLNAGLGFDQLWNVNISDTVPLDVIQVNLDYARQGENQVAIGETLELDPTVNLTYASAQSPAVSTSAVASGGDYLGCIGRSPPYGWGLTYGNNMLRNYIAGWYTWSGCRVAMTGFDLSGISDLATITDVDVTYDVTYASNNAACSWNQLTQRDQHGWGIWSGGQVTTTGTNPYRSYYDNQSGSPNAYHMTEDMYYDANNMGTQPNGAGHQYIATDNNCLTVGTGYTLDLGTNADSDLQDQLTAATSIDGVADWFGLGMPSIKMDDGISMINDGTNDVYHPLLSQDAGVDDQNFANIVLTVVYTAPVAPDPPTSLTSSQAIVGQVDLAWTASAYNGGDPITSYKIFEGGSLVFDCAVTCLTYSHTGISAGSAQSYTVTAVNGVGDSVASNTSTITVWDVPDQVTNFVANDSATPILTWTAPATDQPITNYKIYRDTVLHDTIGVPSPLSYTDTTSLVGGQTYSYQASAVSSVGEGALSTADTALVLVPPDPPQNLTATIPDAQNNPLVVSLTFDEPSDWGTGTPTSYDLLEDVGSTGSFTTIASALPYAAGQFTHSHTITTVTPLTDFDYKVIANTPHGTSADSNVAQVTTVDVPSSPTNVTNTIDDPDNNPYEIKVQWSAGFDGGTNTDGYKIERFDDNTNAWSVIVADTGNTSTTYTETVPSLVNTQFNYRISQINIFGTSAVSVESNAVTTPDYPDPPINLTLTLDPNNATNILVEWAEPLDNGGSAINDFAIYRGQVGNMTPYVNPTGNTLLFYNDTPVALSTQYCYEITASNAVGWSQKSSNSCSTTHGVPDPPLNLTVELDNSNTPPNSPMINLAWDLPPSMNGGTLSHYTIERNIDGAGWLDAIPSTTSQAAVDMGLSSGIDYQYRVTATSQIGTSGVSNMANGLFSEGTLLLTGGALAGNTVYMIPTITISEAQPNPTATILKIYKGTTFTDIIHEETCSVACGLTPTVPEQPYALHYEYPQAETSYTARIWTTQDQSTTLYESSALTITPLQPFSDNIYGSETRDATYTSSDWTFIAQPADYTLVLRYQHQDPSVDPTFYGYENVIADVSDSITVSASANYYISAYLNPTAFDYTIGANNEITEIICNENSPAIAACVENPTAVLTDIPNGVASEFVIISSKDPNAEVQTLGIEGMGDLFGMPMVFLFVIGFASLFTNRSAHMGVVFVGALVGIMFAMGYITFGTDDVNIAIWGILIVIIILGVLLGKKYV